MRKDSPGYEQILSDLTNKILHPIYFLTGDENYYIDKLTDYIIENILPENEKAFNQTILYGKDVDAVAIDQAARRYPMMANNQVIIVKEAQDIKNFDALINYFENPLKSTVLVFNYKYKSLDKRFKVYKALQKNAVFFESKKLYDDKIPAWITSWLKPKNYTIDPKAAILLMEFLGNDLSKIANELQKLIISLPENLRNISPAHIETNIGISKDYNNFELHEALTSKNVLKANRIIRYFAANPKNNNITVTISLLYFFFVKVFLYHTLADKSRGNAASILKINPYFVEQYSKAAGAYSPGKLISIFAWLREYDLKSKGYSQASSDPGELMKELIFKILH
jgi:DNA polymerase-3 subunit delta